MVKTTITKKSTYLMRNHHLRKIKMKLFKVQKSISFIPFDYPDPLMSDIFKYKYKSQGSPHWVNSGKSEGRLDFLYKLGYKIPVLENNENIKKSYMTFIRKINTPRRVRFPSLSRILKRINPERKSLEPGRIRIKYKTIWRGLQKSS